MRPPKPGLRRSRAGDPARDLARRGATTSTLDGPRTKRELLDQIAAALHFPSWTGRNWDALADALGDLSWLPPGPYALVWREPGRLDPDAYPTAIDVLAQAAAGSAGTEHPLTVVLAGGRRR